MTTVEAKPSAAAQQAAAAKPASVAERAPELDALRGLAVAGMILADSPGSWTKTYAQLKHADWQGWTATDMVFPGFLFAVGVAIAVSFRRLAEGGPGGGPAWGRIARRCAALIGLGLLLQALPAFDLQHLRLPGILQRIAFCYGAAAALCLATARPAAEGRRTLDPRALALSATLLLAGYWTLLAFVPTPGFGAGRFDPLGALPAYIDRLVFTVPHLWPYGTAPDGQVTYDPEGLLSTLGAICTALLGVLAGWWLQQGPLGRRTLGLVGAGVLLLAAGEALDPVLPIIKRLWTPSFVLVSGGVALLALAALRTALRWPAARAAAWPLRWPAARAAAWPLRVFGGNAILAFVLCQLLGVFSGLVLVPSADGPATPEAWGFALAGRLAPDPYLASLLCALAALGLILAVIAPLHARRIHLKL